MSEVGEIEVGLVGLGAMGAQIGEALLDAGYSLAVYDTRAEAMAAPASRGARACSCPGEVADFAQIVLVSLPTPDVVREVACGENGVVRGGAARTFVDLSTTGAVVAREVATTLREAGIDHLDAPVSGGVAGAAARTLTVMSSGTGAAFEQVKPLLETFARNIFLVGELPGQAQVAKLLNNLLSATALAITSEAMTVGARAGLDAGTLLEIFNASSGRNTATSDRFPAQVLTRRFAGGFRLKLMAKDVELCLGEARSQQTPMVVGAVVQQLWTLAALHADDDDDFTEIVRLFEGWTGTTIAASAQVDG